MSYRVSGFQSFFSFLHHFLLAKLVTGSIRVKSILVSIDHKKLIIRYQLRRMIKEQKCIPIPKINPYAVGG